MEEEKDDSKEGKWEKNHANGCINIIRIKVKYVH